MSYSIGRDADGKIVAINDWQTREQADASLSKAASWIRDNMAEQVHLISAHVVGFSFTVTAIGLGRERGARQRVNDVSYTPEELGATVDEDGQVAAVTGPSRAR